MDEHSDYQNQNNLPLKGDYSSIFELAPVAIVVIDENGIILKLNGRICDWLNYKLDDAIGKNIFVLPFLTKFSKLTILEKYTERMDGAQAIPYEIELRTKEGEIRKGMVCESQIIDPEDGQKKSLVVISDVTGFSSASSSADLAGGGLQNVQELYNAIQGNTLVALIVTDMDDLIMSWNPFTETLLGMTAEELNQKPVKELYSDNQWNKMSALYQDPNTKADIVESVVTTADGSTLDVECSLSILKDKDGNKSGALCVIKDISRRKHAQREIFKAHKMRKDFLSMVSHELKTPITAIQGSIGIILDGSAGSINEEQKDFLDTAKRNLDRLDCLIDDVLYYQKLEIGETEFKMEEGNINELIESIRHEIVIMVEEKKLDFHADLFSGMPNVMFDKDKIKKVIINLVENSVKFTKEGSVTIKTSCPKGVVCVAIKDTGVGIKDTDIKKLFQIFGQLTTGARRETGNTGLGLVIAKNIIEKHRGKIWVESEYGKGTTFFFLLPSV